MKKHIQIKDSFNTWLPATMKAEIQCRAPGCMGNYKPLVIEWWLHNIGFWVTKPFVKKQIATQINLRCKDVDLMVEVSE